MPYAKLALAGAMMMALVPPALAQVNPTVDCTNPNQALSGNCKSPTGTEQTPGRSGSGTGTTTGTGTGTTGGTASGTTGGMGTGVGTTGSTTGGMGTSTGTTGGMGTGGSGTGTGTK
jgi:hypothetical protein